MLSTPETTVHVLDKNREISPLEREEGYGGKDLEKRWVLRREWKTMWENQLGRVTSNWRTSCILDILKAKF